jgi:citrate lyase alpha subunit
MRTRMSAVVVAISVLVALIGAQSTRGQLAGTVKDASGAALPGVTITISVTERRTAITNERGEFTFTNLLQGP